MSSAQIRILADATKWAWLLSFLEGKNLFQMFFVENLEFRGWESFFYIDIMLQSQKSKLFAKMEKEMKKLTLFFFVFCISLIFIGCDNSEEKTEGQSLVQEQTVTETTVQPVKKVFAKKEAIVLYPGTPLYTEDVDGKMIYADEVAKGDKLFVYYDGDNVDSKEAIRKLKSGQEDPFTFVRVATEFSGDYWTRELFFAKEHSVGGVILEDSYIYNSPQSFDVTGNTLKKGELVALKNNIDYESVFTAVTIYNGADNGKEIYLKTDAISTKEADVLAVKTMEKVKSYEKLDPVVESKLLEIFVDMEITPAVWEFLFAGEQ